MDDLNDRADIIFVGATPGFTQAVEATKTVRKLARAGASVEFAAKAAKETASFKGLRTTMGALMDACHLNRVFEVAECEVLFASSAHRVHSTSALRYPVLKKGKNFSGDKRVMLRKEMRTMVERHLVPELAALPNAWIVPFGACSLAVLDDLTARGLVDERRVLGGVLHPSGQQRNRHRVQLGEVTGAAAHAVSGGRAVVERTEALRAKVKTIVGGRRHAA